MAHAAETIWARHQAAVLRDNAAKNAGVTKRALKSYEGPRDALGQSKREHDEAKHVARMEAEKLLQEHDNRPDVVADRKRKLDALAAVQAEKNAITAREDFGCF